MITKKEYKLLLVMVKQHLDMIDIHEDKNTVYGLFCEKLHEKLLHLVKDTDVD